MSKCRSRDRCRMSRALEDGTVGRFTVVVATRTAENWRVRCKAFASGGRCEDAGRRAAAAYLFVSWAGCGLSKLWLLRAAIHARP